eukprot:COSAG01_NODE_16923_length_1193_cov_1.721207_1_plen_270_part_01
MWRVIYYMCSGEGEAGGGRGWVRGCDINRWSAVVVLARTLPACMVRRSTIPPPAAGALCRTWARSEMAARSACCRPTRSGCSGAVATAPTSGTARSTASRLAPGPPYHRSAQHSHRTLAACTDQTPPPSPTPTSSSLTSRMVGPQLTCLSVCLCLLDLAVRRRRRRRGGLQMGIGRAGCAAVPGPPTQAAPLGVPMVVSQRTALASMPPRSTGTHAPPDQPAPRKLGRFCGGGGGGGGQGGGGGEGAPPPPRPRGSRGPPRGAAGAGGGV